MEDERMMKMMRMINWSLLNSRYASCWQF